MPEIRTKLEKHKKKTPGKSPSLLDPKTWIIPRIVNGLVHPTFFYWDFCRVNPLPTGVNSPTYDSWDEPPSRIPQDLAVPPSSRIFSHSSGTRVFIGTTLPRIAVDVDVVVAGGLKVLRSFGG